jgi:Protein of unknown function (DUF4065)
VPPDGYENLPRVPLNGDRLPSYDVGMIDTDRKLEELLLFVADATAGDERCNAAKLDKILFYADFRAHGEIGRSMTGQRYRKLEGGPVPVRIAEVLEDMERRGLCVREGNKLRPLRRADLSVLSVEELEITRAVVQDLWTLSAAEVSDLSHRFPGWQAAEIGEEIPYETVFVDEPRPLTPEEVAWAHEAIGDFLGQQTA